jgi:multidrug efflux pump subunit AcrA (membrane-fusion protein)
MAKPSPRFRKDLSAAATEQDGVPCVLVTDPLTGTSFTFYEFEYDLAHQLDGQLDDDIIAWGVANYATALTPEAIEEFGKKLGELGFLEGVDAESPRTAEAQWKASEGAPSEQDTPDEVTLAGAKPGGASHAATKKATRPELEGIDDLPLDALMEMPDSGPTSSSGIPKVMPGTMSGAVSSPFASSGGVSRGFFERRQPPGPEAVVATPFEDVSLRFRAPPPERQRSSTALIVTILVLLVGGGGGGYFFWMRQHPKLPEALRLRVIAPRPTAVYRWFATAGTVVDLESRTMAFDSGGKVVEMLPAGTKFVAGDTLGKLQGANGLEGDLATNKSKLAYFEQLRDSMKASGKGKEKANLRDVEDKIAARKKMLSDVEASLAKLVLRATEPGAIVETPVKVGTVVAAKAPALRWRGHNLHGDFTMDQEDFAKAAKLDFCRVEVLGFATPGAGTPAPASPSAASPTPASTSATDAGASGSGESRFVDCTLPPPASPPANGVPSLLRKFIVTLPTDAGLVTGQQLHLSRKRFDGVFPVALTAIANATETGGEVWIAAPNGTAEKRSVTVAESRDEALVSQGLNVGDEVIVEPPRDLQPGALVEPIR